MLQEAANIEKENTHNPEKVKKLIADSELVLGHMRSFLKTLSSLRRGNEKAALELLPKVPPKAKEASASDSDKDSKGNQHDMTPPAKSTGFQPLASFFNKAKDNDNMTPSKVEDIKDNKDASNTKSRAAIMKAEPVEAGRAAA